MDNSHKTYESGNRECHVSKINTDLNDLIIDDWVCRICGSVHFQRNLTNYECSGCSVVFGNPHKMNLPWHDFLN